MMVHLDTSALVDALTGPRRSLDALTALVDEGHRLGLSAIVLYEWLRGPRTPADLDAQEALFPAEAAVPFGSGEARRSAALCGQVRRSRGREVDLAIAACALAHDAALWTLNPADFRDIPGLRLI
jgi:predicted nucleic acid-binding protein